MNLSVSRNTMMICLTVGGVALLQASPNTWTYHPAVKADSGYWEYEVNVVTPYTTDGTVNYETVPSGPYAGNSAAAIGSYSAAEWHFPLPPGLDTAALNRNSVWARYAEIGIATCPSNDFRVRVESGVLGVQGHMPSGFWPADIAVKYYNLALDVVPIGHYTFNEAFQCDHSTSLICTGTEVLVNGLFLQIGVKNPASPATLTIGSVTDSRINLSWSSSANAENYVLVRGESAFGPWQRIHSGPATQYIDQAVMPSHTYFYGVLAEKSNVGWSDTTFSGYVDTKTSPKIRATSSTLTPAIQSEFTVRLDVAGMDNLFTAAFDVDFQKDIIELLSVTEGTAFNSDGKGTVFLKTINNNYSATNGKAIIAITRLNPDKGVSVVGYNDLVDLRFRVKHEGSTAIDISNVGLMSDNNTQWGYSGQNLPVSLNVPIPTSVSTLTVLPAGAQAYTNDNIDVAVTLTACQNLHGVAFDLTYDPTIVQYQSFQEGTLLNHNGTYPIISPLVTANGNHLTVGYMRQGSNPGITFSTTQTVLTLKFKALKIGTASLDLSNIGLFAPNGTTTYPSVGQNSTIPILNEPPVLTSITIPSGRTSYLRGQPVAFRISATDREDPANLTFELAYRQSDDLTFTNIPMTMDAPWTWDFLSSSWNSTFTVPLTMPVHGYYFLARARDGQGAYSTVTALGPIISIINNLPVVSTPVPSELTLQEDEIKTFDRTANFTDLEDGSVQKPLTFSVYAPGLDPAIIQSAVFTGGVLSVTPAVNASGRTGIRIDVQDADAGVAQVNVTLVVTPVNDPPAITGQNALFTRRNTPLAVRFPDLAVTDPDNTYPSGFTTHLQAGTHYSISGDTVKPEQNFSGTLTIPVTVNDGQASSQPYDLQITVANNVAPTVTAFSPNTDTVKVFVDSTVHFSATFADPDNPVVPKWLLDGNPSDSVISFENTGTFSVIARDSDGQDSVQHEWIVVVKPFDQSTPVVRPIGTDGVVTVEYADGSRFGFTFTTGAFSGANLTVTYAGSTSSALLPGVSGLFFDIESNIAGTFAVQYSISNTMFTDNFTLAYLDGAHWQVVTGNYDAATHTLYGMITHFSHWVAADKSAFATAVEKLRIASLPKRFEMNAVNGRILLQVPYFEAGEIGATITVSDIRGRMVYRQNLPQVTPGCTAITLPANISRGWHILRFRSVAFNAVRRILVE